MTVSALNSCLCNVLESSPGFWLQIYISQRNCKMPLKVCFVENELAGTLEASDFDKANQIAQFIASVVDLFWRNQDNVMATVVFTFYVDLLFFLLKLRV